MVANQGEILALVEDTEDPRRSQAQVARARVLLDLNGYAREISISFCRRISNI